MCVRPYTYKRFCRNTVESLRGDLTPLFSAPEFDRKNVEQIKHLPSQKKYRNQHNHDGQKFAKAEAASVGLETSRSQAQNIQRGKAEYNGPEDVVEIVSRAAIKNGRGYAKGNRAIGAHDRIRGNRRARRAREAGKQ